MRKNCSDNRDHLYRLQQKHRNASSERSPNHRKANYDLDQSNSKNPSLNSILGCLKVVDTFRALIARSPDDLPVGEIVGQPIKRRAPKEATERDGAVPATRCRRYPFPPRTP